MITSRRGFISGLSALIAAPAIVRASSLMPVRSIIMPITFTGIGGDDVFRYVVMTDGITKDGILWWDYGRDVRMIAGDTFTLAMGGGRNIVFGDNEREKRDGNETFVLLKDKPPF